MNCCHLSWQAASRDLKAWGIHSSEKQCMGWFRENQNAVLNFCPMWLKQAV